MSTSSSPPGFNLLRLLGRGGMGEVFLAKRQADGVSVALKVAHGSLGQQGIERLRREAALLSKVESRVLPRYLGFFEHQDRWILAMEFVEGTPLDAWVKDMPSEAERLALVQRCLPDLADALSVLHESEIIHRDLKPANCILGKDRCVLVDLGLARGHDVKTLTATGMSVGTPDYLPPEQVSGELVTAKADVYQLALIARDLLLGPRRDQGGNPVHDLMRRSVQAPPDLHRDHSWIPAALSDWIREALHPDQDVRPDAEKHLQAARGLCEGLQVNRVEASEPSWMGPLTESLLELPRRRAQAKADGWTGDTGPRTTGPDDGPGEHKRVAIPAPVRPGADGSATAPGPMRWVAMGLIGVSLGAWGATIGRGSRGLFEPLDIETVGTRVLVPGTPSGVVLRTSKGVLASRGEDGLLGVEFEGLEGETLHVLVPGQESREFAIPPRWFGEVTAEATASGLRIVVPLGSVQPQFGQFESEGEVVRAAGTATLTFDVGARVLDREDARVAVATGGGIRLIRSLALGDLLGQSVRAALPERIERRRWEEHARASDGSADASLAIWGEPTLRSILANRHSYARYLGAASIAEDARYDLYELLAPVAVAEWFGESAPWVSHWAANHALGRHLAISGAPSVPGSRSAGESEQTVRLGGMVRLGSVDAAKRRLRGVEDTGGIPGEYMSDGGFSARVPGFDRRLPGRCEIGMRVVGTDAWTALAVRLGSRQLLLPLESGVTWRSLRVPPEWFRDAVSVDGLFEFEIRGWDGLATAMPSRAAVSEVGISAIYPKD